MRTRPFLPVFLLLISWSILAAQGEAEKKPAVEQPAVAEEATPIWTVLDPHEFKAAKGSTLTKQTDKSILASGANPTPETYTIRAHTALKGITAIRLEVLTDPSLPNNGPGRAGNGNFVLNTFSVQAAPKGTPDKAQPVALKTATATAAQVNFAPQTMIDGNTPALGGWAVGSALGQRHAVIFELKQAISHEEGTTLTIAMLQEHTGTLEHNIGRFRLSVTSSQAPFPFKEELKSLVWTTLDPKELKTAKGTTLTRQADRSVLASGANPLDEDYIITAHTPLKEITAIRLEVLPDPNLPNRGPGRSGINGNFVLNDFQVKTSPRNKAGDARAVALGAASADYSQPSFEIATLASGNWNAQVGGWAIDQQTGRKHVAVFELKEPIRHAEGAALTIRLVHRHANKDWVHNIGRFRLSVTTSKAPFPLEVQSLTAEDLETFWTELGSADDDRARAAGESLFQSGHAEWFLKQQLKPELAKVDGKQLAQWIADLDDNAFRVRENATTELEKLGPLAAAALVAVVERGPSLEARRRAERLVDKLKSCPDVVRPQRAVDVLVRTGSPQARELLANLAKGSADAILTQAARAGMARLDKKTP